MFGLGFGEMVVIALLAIVVVGPDRLPTLFKTVGGAMRQMRQASRDIRSSVGLDELMDLDERRPKPAATARVKPPVDAAPVSQAPIAHAAPSTGPASGGPNDPTPQG